MDALALHAFHSRRQARFREVNQRQAVAHYANPHAEWRALRETAALIDVSFRSRLCLTGPDRLSFLNGQVTNNLKDLAPGNGCYACLLNARGKIQTDLNIYSLLDELLLDFEPGWTDRVRQRLDHYIIADDVQVVDVTPHCGQFLIAGPRAGLVLEKTGLGLAVPRQPWAVTQTVHDPFGELYCALRPLGPTAALDLYVPVRSLEPVAERFSDALASQSGCAAGWDALETFRIESGIPRFGADMDETNLPPEAGLETRAISYTKGCYIGQEIIARLRTYGQVAKSLRGLRFLNDSEALPQKGDKLFAEGKDAGYATSAAHSPSLNAVVALGYVRREHNQPGTTLILRTAHGDHAVQVVDLPFVQPDSSAGNSGSNKIAP